jgi:ParB-like chromosome segregation protein Spo0J
MTASPHDIAAWLDSHHVRWTFHDALDLVLVDVARSLANQARVGEPLIEDVVDTYTTDYKNGATFPPIITRRASKNAKKVTILGGNHRFTAATRAGLTTHPAYVVECEPEMAIVLAYEDNRYHGAQLSTAQKVRQAIHLIGLGWPQQDAARAVGVSAPKVSMAMKAEEGIRRAADLDVDGFDQLAQSTQTELARIQSDPVFVETTRLVADARLGTDAVKTLAARVKRAGSDEKALKLLGAERETLRPEMQATAGGKAKKKASTPYSVLNAALFSVVDVRPAELVSSVPTADAKESLRRLIKDGARHLMAIDTALKAAR